MAFTLRVVFEGVCAFVPSEPLFRNPDPTEPIEQMSVLLPDLRLPELAYWDRDPRAPSACWRAPHLAFLEVEREALFTGTNARIDLDWHHRPSRRRRAAFLFDQRRLRVEGGRGEPLVVEQGEGSGSTPRNDHEARSLWWLPRMAEIAPHFAWVQARRRQAELGKMPAIAGSVQIREGLIYVGGFNRQAKDEEPSQWSFGPVARDEGGQLVLPPRNQARWNRAIGNRIHWELQVEEAAVFQLIDSNDQVRSVVVRPPVGSDGDPIEVRVGNMEPEVGLFDSTPFFGALREALPDPDFQAFYRLVSDQTVPAVAAPWPVPFSFDTALGQHEKPCAPALFNGFGKDET